MRSPWVASQATRHGFSLACIEPDAVGGTELTKGWVEWWMGNDDLRAQWRGHQIIAYWWDQTMQIYGNVDGFDLMIYDGLLFKNAFGLVI